MTTLRLGDPHYAENDGFRDVFAEVRPSLFVAYPYLGDFIGRPLAPLVRDWALDSGAFSAHSLGIKIDRTAFHDTAKELMAADPRLVEVLALDVIGDWRASLTNAEAAWSDGIPAIPTYHVGDPAHVLDVMARDYPKVALGGAVRYAHKIAWANACFARVWPKPLHGLGFGSPDSIMTLPFHSVDATTWFMAPRAYGNWPHMTSGVQNGNSRPRTRRVNQRMMSGPVRFYRKLEDKAKMRWSKEMAELDAMLAEVGWRGIP